MWSRAFAGVIAGFFLSAGTVGLVSWMLPGQWQNTIVPASLCFIACWVAAAAGAFGFSSGRRAWAWLCSLALLSFSLLWTLRALGWVQ